MERLIGIVGERLAKSTEGTLAKRVNRILWAYNNTHHSAIGCTPLEAMNKMRTGNMLTKNSAAGKYAKKFKRGLRERFVTEQKLRIADTRI